MLFRKDHAGLSCYCRNGLGAGRNLMGKNIVFCADGTWNGPGEPDAENTASPDTNVFKLYLNLAGADTPGTALLADEQERVLPGPGGAALQWSKYIYGVGDSDNFLVRILGGSLGAGLITRVIRGYTFISRNYVAGDRIFITGFSRGAYTARALAGMIAAKGLLDATRSDLDDKPAAYAMGSSVWYAFRRAAAQSQSDWFQKLANTLICVPDIFNTPVPDSKLIRAPVDTVAVWDTVGALGIPAYTMQSQRIDFLQFADRALSPVVQHGYHAVALDEQRSDFTPTLWDADPRIVQMLFPGAHADVGGGYPIAGRESALSDAALVWMTQQLQDRGVLFAAPPACESAPGCDGPAHQPWTSGIWPDLPHAPRDFSKRSDLRVASEVVARMQFGTVIPNPGKPPAEYRPTNLPPKQTVA
jgi:uncharacterized protein (DUF2235 family)